MEGMAGMEDMVGLEGMEDMPSPSKEDDVLLDSAL